MITATMRGGPYDGQEFTFSGYCLVFPILVLDEDPPTLEEIQDLPIFDEYGYPIYYGSSIEEIRCPISQDPDGSYIVTWPEAVTT